ncbi:MAG: PLP-dependent aminotransferase family protein [Pyramidobacter sp.]|jgi:2-aminoadipate transaminase
MKLAISRRAAHLRHSAMDEFFSPGVEKIIPFNAGQPAADQYPLDLLRPIFHELLENERDVMAYPHVAGDPELLSALADRMNRLGIGRGVSPENIVTTVGATGGADIASQLFIDPDDLVLCETPTFTETLDCMYKSFARLRGVPMDNEGPLPDALEALAKTNKVKMFYVIPNFQNPTGRCTSLERRKSVVEIARRYGFMILEDDPYHELSFGEEPPASYYSLAPDCTVYMGSLSKTIAPGVRLGWLVLPQELRERAAMLIKSTILAYPALLERGCARLLRHPQFDAHVDRLRFDLKRRYKRLTSLMREKISPELLNWETPLGGMFLWCHVPDSCDARQLALLARDTYGVAFFPGMCFTPDFTGEEHSLRLTYARPSDEEMAEGVARIALVLKDVMA